MHASPPVRLVAVRRYGLRCAMLGHCGHYLTNDLPPLYRGAAAQVRSTMWGHFALTRGTSPLPIRWLFFDDDSENPNDSGCCRTPSPYDLPSAGSAVVAAFDGR